MEEKEIKGVRIRTICFVLLAAACILFVLLLGGLINITTSYQELLQTTDTYMDAENNIRQMEDAHTYLTETSRQYVITMDRAFMDAYFEEVYDTMRREAAVDELTVIAKGQHDLRLALESVFEDSNKMMQMEIHAMKLIAVLQGIEPDEMPDDIAEYELSEEERAYTDKEMQESAYQLLFNSNYELLQQRIVRELGAVADEISGLTRQAQMESEEELHDALIKLQVYIMLLFLLSVVIFIILIFFVMRPVNRYVSCIEEEKDIAVKGLYEFKFLAYTYNKMHNRNTQKSHALKRKAEHDALTGIWNRATFEQLKDDLSKSLEPLTLLLIDVDNFKGVNDNYGHETGDHALKKVADMLKEQFRSNDYPIRIGGDEFAVLMVNATPREKAIIRQKLTFINETLQKGTDALPPLSLSVGIAFSAAGYSDDLYRKADAALYRTKENGKCGFTFHGE